MNDRNGNGNGNINNVSCAIGQAWLNTLHMKPGPDDQISTLSVDNFQLKQFGNLFSAVNIDNDNVSMFCEAIFYV